MVKWLAGGLLVAIAVAACSEDSVVDGGCIGRTPGVIVQVAGIDLQVRDPFGRGQAIGTTATVRPTTGAALTTLVADTLNIQSAFNTAGTFLITVTRPYYVDATVDHVTVTPTSCAVNTTTVPVTLQLAPGAPALRALAIIGGTFLDHPGAQAHLLPHFDANPDVSTAVTWQVSDATLASIDANGVVTAKCTKDGGTVKVTATAVADGATTAFVNIGVAGANCP